MAPRLDLLSDAPVGRSAARRGARPALVPALAPALLLAPLLAAGCTGAPLQPPVVPEGVGPGPVVRPPPGDPPPFVPADARLRRLLGFQYRNAIQDLLGSDAAAVVDPPADVPLNGFVSVGAATLSLSPTDVEKLEASAFAAAQVAVHGEGPRAFRVCAPSAFDDASCASQTVAAFGRRAFRRPLTADELSRWTAIAAEGAAAYGDFDMGLEYAFAGMLQSPSFVYLVEVGEPVAGDAAHRRLTGYELASRLSFFLVGTTPSDALLDAAGRGDLDTREGVRLYAEALLTEDRAREALRGFFAEKLGLGVLLGIDRPGTGLGETVRTAMQEETLRFIDDIVWQRNADARELFTGGFSYMNDELASFYGLPLPGQGSQMVRVPLGEASGRGGLLTQGSFLARFAHVNRSSPTLRGKFIRESIMCQAVPAPPDDVETTLPEPTDDDIPQTTRDRMAYHMSEERCADCHAMMDPLGFALEGFDQAGRARTHERGLPVNTASDLDGEPVAGANELARALAAYPDVPGCLVKNLFRHGTGHLEEPGEDHALLLVSDAFEGSGFRLRDGLLEIVLSDAFRHVAQPEGAQ
jgi:hypothetical protein